MLYIYYNIMDLEKLIKSRNIYPKPTIDKLLRVINTQFNSIDSIIHHRDEQKKILIIYKEDVYGLNLILDLTQFIHPFGIGPNMNYYKKTKYIDITEEFNNAGHRDEDIIKLLSFIYGYFI
jgi:hypothetical protein